jgi:hypothetical protein
MPWHFSESAFYNIYFIKVKDYFKKSNMRDAFSLKMRGSIITTPSIAVLITSILIVYLLFNY